MTRLHLVPLLMLLTQVVAAPIDLGQAQVAQSALAAPTPHLPPDLIAPSPTGSPPGPSIKTVTQPSSTAARPAASNASASVSAEGQGLAVGPAGAFGLAAPSNSSSLTPGSRLGASGVGADSTMKHLMADKTSTHLVEDDEEGECEDMPGSVSPAAGVAAAAPPVPAGEGSNSTIPLTPSPVKPDEKQPAAEQSSQPSGMDNFMGAGGGIGGKMRRDLLRAGRLL